jgi:hypothetical protein
VVFAQVLLFHIQKIKLLWAKDRPGPADSNPADESSRRKFEMLHGINSY